MESPTLARPYPQMPPLTDEEVSSLLEAVLIARLATHNPDGSIHLVPVQFKYVDGAILLGTNAISRKVKNIERDPNVTVLVDIEEMPAKGAMIYGTATLDTGDLVAERIEIFDRSMPHEVAEPFANSLAAQWEPAVIRVIPTKIVSWDYSKGSVV